MPNGYETMESGSLLEQLEQEQLELSGAEVFSEALETELAAELLELRDEAELDQFLGKLISRAGRAIGQVVKSPIGRAVGGVLKTVAKKALPIAGGALGAWVGGPLGAKIGSGLASAAGKAFGLELQELSAEEQELEGARQFVRFAGDTVKRALAAPPTADPRQVVSPAAVAAARRHLPGLMTGAGSSVGPLAGTSRSGRWVRAGRNILVLNV
jgi:hypothetical protein